MDTFYTPAAEAFTEYVTPAPTENMVMPAKVSAKPGAERRIGSVASWVVASALLSARPVYTCADSFETVTLHSGCHVLVLRSCHSPDALSRLARFAAWKRPWQGAPRLFLPKGEGASRTALVEAGEQFGDGLLWGLSRLPGEVVLLFRRYSEESALWRLVAALDLAGRLARPEGQGLVIPLRDIAGWERGMVVPSEGGGFEKGSVTRLTIDAQGVRSVRRLPCLEAQSRWHGAERQRFLVLNEDAAEGIAAVFQVSHPSGSGWG